MQSICLSEENVSFSMLMNILSPYQAEFMEAVKKHPCLDGTIYFLGKTQGRDWKSDTFKYNFDYHFLDARHVAGDKFVSWEVLNREIYHQDFVIVGSLFCPSNFMTYMKALLLRKKIILWSEAVLPADNPYGQRLKQWLYPVLLRPVERILAIGEKSIRSFHEEYNVPLEKIHNFPYSRKVDFEYDESLCAEIDRKYRNGKVLVLFAGQFIKRKGIDFLLKALSLIPYLHDKINVLMIGSGKEEQNLRDLVQENQLNCVRFKGFVQPDELMNYFKMADIFVTPSRYDGWGVVVNEAMAAGTCVMVSDRMGAKELIEDGKNGMIIEMDEAIEKFAQKLALLIEDPALRERIAEEGLSTINEYSVEKMAEKLYRILLAIKNTP